MDRWSAEYRTFAEKTYFRNNDSVVTQRIFRRRFNIRRNYSFPSRNTLLLWVRNFIETALPAKENREEGSLLLELLSIERLRQAVVRSPQRSASRKTLASRMSDCTVRRILHRDLNFYPYKMFMVQVLNDQDTVNRKTVCEDLLKALGNDDINQVFVTNEANFHVCGYVSSQNCRYWVTENPRDIRQELLRSEQVIVWCLVASFGFIGPYFFEDEAGRAVTVNSARYIEMLRTFLEPELQRLGVEIQALSARRSSGSHCEECNASPQRDVTSSRDLTKREY
jgi:hypothetical protein